MRLHKAMQLGSNLTKHLKNTEGEPQCSPLVLRLQSCDCTSHYAIWCVALPRERMGLSPNPLRLPLFKLAFLHAAVTGLAFNKTVIADSFVCSGTWSMRTLLGMRWRTPWKCGWCTRPVDSRCNAQAPKPLVTKGQPVSWSATNLICTGRFYNARKAEKWMLKWRSLKPTTISCWRMRNTKWLKITKRQSRIVPTVTICSA